MLVKLYYQEQYKGFSSLLSKWCVKNVKSNSKSFILRNMHFNAYKFK